MIVHEPDGILEIGQAGHSKASGIERLCASLGIAKEDTYAFGDSANDVEMLEFVAHGIAMGMVRMWQRMRQNLLPQISIKMGSGTD